MVCISKWLFLNAYSNDKNFGKLPQAMNFYFQMPPAAKLFYCSTKSYRKVKRDLRLQMKNLLD